MDEAIVQFLMGHSDDREVAELQRWRRSAPANEAYFQEQAALWELLGTVPPVPTSTPPPATDLIRSAMRSGPISSLPYPRRGRLLWAIVMVAGIVVFGAGLIRVITDRPGTPAFGALEFITGRSELATVRLDDGSIVRLAPQSSLRLVGGDGAREVWLSGRAFFAVAHDEERPFIVRTGAGEALVMGTRFEVRAAEEELRVVVVEGRISLNAGGESADVEAGEISEIAREGGPKVQRVEDVYGLIGWVGNFMAFEATPLSEVAREVEERYGLTISIANQVLAERTITAWFSDQEPGEVMTVICRVVNAECTEKEGVVLIE